MAAIVTRLISFEKIWLQGGFPVIAVIAETTRNHNFQKKSVK